MTDFLALLGAGEPPNLMAQDAAAEKPQYRRLQRADVTAAFRRRLRHL
jgi:hypothetical protein